jgi:predicted Zn-dependent protease
VTRAGIDPRGIPSMFRTLMQERQRQPSALDSWFATHPLEETRIAAAERQIQSTVSSSVLPSLTRESRNFDAFQRRLRSLPAAPARQAQTR